MPLIPILLGLSYLLGTVSFGLLSAKIFNLQDPRTIGSKNIGATNILRLGSKKAAIFTLVGDLLKGYIAVYISKYFAIYFYLSNDIVFYAGLFALIGHIFPIFLKFKGGKGVATIAGVLLALEPIIGLIAILSWMISAFILKYSSLAALISSIFILISSAIIYKFSSSFYIILLMLLLVIYKHKSNIINLLQGKEPKITNK